MEISMMSNPNYESFDVISFKLGEKAYATDVRITEIILERYKIFRVPNSPDFLKGIINLRGEIIPVLDLKSMINFESKGTFSNIIIVKIDESRVGFLVDEVTEIMHVRSVELTTVKIGNSNYIKGAIMKGNRLISLLDLQNLLVERIKFAREEKDEQKGFDS